MKIKRGRFISLMQQALDQVEQASGEPAKYVYLPSGLIGMKTTIKDAFPGINLGVVIDPSLPDGTFYFSTEELEEVPSEDRE